MKRTWRDLVIELWFLGYWAGSVAVLLALLWCGVKAVVP